MKHPRSCKDIAKNGASTSGKYDISNSDNERFSVYCDLQSEPGFVWTLIQSFSLAKKNASRRQGLAKTLRLILKRGKWIGTSSDYPYHRCSTLLITPHIWEQLVTFLRMVCSIRTTHALSWQVMTFLVPGTPARCTNMSISEESIVLIAPPWQDRRKMCHGT